MEGGSRLFLEEAAGRAAKDWLMVCGGDWRSKLGQPRTVFEGEDEDVVIKRCAQVGAMQTCVKNLEEKIAAGEEKIKVKKLQIKQDDLKVGMEIQAMKDNLDKEIRNMTSVQSQRAAKVEQECLEISAKVKEFKNRKAGFQEAMKKPQQKHKNENVENGGKKIKPNIDFTTFLKNSITTKERELECPICLEVEVHRPRFELMVNYQKSSSVQ